MTDEARSPGPPLAAGEARPAVVAGWAVRVDDLRLSLPVDAPTAPRPVVRGLTLQAAEEAIREGLAYASTALDRLSRAKVEEFLDELSASPRLRSIRWYYASLFRLAAVENGLDVDGGLTGGAILVRARFRSAPESGVLGQLRDLAKRAVSVIARLSPSVGDNGRLRVRIDLDPDVRGLIAKLLVGALAKQPGIHRLDDATVEVDVGVVVGQEASVPVDWEAVVRAVEVTPAALTIEFGPPDMDVE